MEQNKKLLKILAKKLKKEEKNYEVKHNRIRFLVKFPRFINENSIEIRIA
jgi:hypothetical protein